MEDQRVRIQPPDLCIPEDDPFGSDRLGRQESVKVLTHIVSQIEGPCVLALDAPWGYGKTTFLKMWEFWLRKQDFKVVAFNAWETDFTHHPFLALSSEVTKELEACSKTTPIPGSDTFKRAAKELLRVAPQLAGSLLPVGGAAAGALLSALWAVLFGKTVTHNDYQKAKGALDAFKVALGGLAQGLNKPLVIMIDELDRCRPSYAVELLEIAKHLFAVDNVVFILAVNRDELVHSVNVLYGAGFDAEGYLRRFFDLDFQLPEPDRKPFVKELLRTTKLASTLVSREGQTQQDAKVLLEVFLDSPKRSLRDVQQVVHRLGMVLALLSTDAAPLALYAVIAIVLRTINFSVYQRFVAGEVSDKEVADEVFGPQGTATLRSETRGWWIEAHIILGSLDAEVEIEARGRDSSVLKSPLLNRYRELRELGSPDDADVRRADSILRYTEILWQDVNWQNSVPLRQRFLDSVRRLELLSSDLGKSGSA